MQKLSTNQIARFFKLPNLLNLFTVFIFFCIQIEYHKMFKMMLSFFCKNAFLPRKRAKRRKSGRGSQTKSTFLYIAQYWLRRFFLIFCMKLETIKGYKLTLNSFLKKILVLPILAIFGHFWLKNRLACILLNIGRLDFFYILSEVRDR